MDEEPDNIDIKEMQREAIKNSDMSDEEKARELLATVEIPKQKMNKKIVALIVVAAVLIIGAIVWKVIDELDIFENKVDDETAQVINQATSISGEKINLSDYNNDVLIEKGGEYVLSGKLAHGVIINSSEPVKLTLDGVEINNTTSAAIANVGTGTIEVILAEGTDNVLSDGGESEQDGCLFSASDMVISGEGTLRVHGRQTEGEGIATDSANLTINGGDIYVESADDGLNAGGDGGMITINGGNLRIKAGGDGIDSNQGAVFNGGVIYVAGSATGGDAGIDTDGGYTINGGTVIALGSDMLETPGDTSKQPVLAFNLGSVINSGTLVTLVDNEGRIIVSFEAMETFRTLVISAAGFTMIEDGGYYLYTGGTHTGEAVKGVYGDGKFSGGTPVSVSGTTSFSLTGAVTLVGQSMGPGGAGGTPPQGGPNW